MVDYNGISELDSTSNKQADTRSKQFDTITGTWEGRHRDHNFEFSKVTSPKARKNLLEEIPPFENIPAELNSAIDDIRTTKEDLEAQGMSSI